ncbi:Retrovirus-related Pol polyprotein, partial [Mucuna pruriens]
MVTLFHDMIHKEVEVYVDDIIAKSKTPKQHINDLLQKYRLKLNPAKCTFGVKTKKLLGLIVNKRGIELDLDKVKAIRNMPAPKSEKEVKGLLGRVNYIASFHFSIDGYLRWNGTKNAKKHLRKSSIPGKPLILYLTMLKESMGGKLAHPPLDEYHALSHEFPDEHILMAEENKSEAEVEG